MTYTSLTELSDGQKEELVVALSCLLIGEGELTAEKISAVASASGNSVSDAMATLFAGVVSKAPKGIETFCPPPGGGGGGGGYVLISFFAAARTLFNHPLLISLTYIC